MEKRKKEKKGRKYYEFFKVREKGKERTVKAEGFEEEEIPSKKQIRDENRILKNIFITLGVVIITILLVYVFINSTRTFEYKDIKFKIVKFCDEKPCLILYQTKFPVISEGKLAEYNFYLRKDPRKVDVPFNGKINFEENSYKNIVINITDELNCDGDATIGVSNIVIFYEILGLEFLRGDTIGCNPEENSIFLDIQKGNKTSIEQTSDLCYKINVNNCEVLEGTEKFLVESFIEVNKLING